MAAASQLHPKEQTFGDDGEGSCWCQLRTSCTAADRRALGCSFLVHLVG